MSLYQDCFVCKETYNKKEISNYCLKDKYVNEKHEYWICDVCCQFLLNLYFKKYSATYITD